MWGPSPMRGPRHLLVTTLLVIVLAAPHWALPPPERVLRRQDARRWKRVVEVAHQTAKASSRRFLEEHGTDLQVPLEVDVFLIGFGGDGAYGYVLEAAKLQQMLANNLATYCPQVWDTQEQLGVCFNVNFIISNMDDMPMTTTLLRHLEDHLHTNMVETHAAYDDQLESGQRRFYMVEAAKMEHLFDDFLDQAFGMDDEGSKGPHAWHKHNVVFVINPSKVRMNPGGKPEDRQHKSPDFMEEWAGGKLDGTKLAAEEAGYVYRYSYEGAGEATMWASSKTYAVIDISAGPTVYGPLISRGGSVTRAGLPSIKSVLSAILEDLGSYSHQITAAEHAAMVANHGQHSLFAGALSGLLMSGVRHLFVPDLATQHLEYAKTILIPLVVLTDYRLSEEEYADLNQEHFFGMNVTHIERAVARLVDTEQEAVVINAHHDLHDHPELAAAVYKALRSHSEAVTDPPSGADLMGANIGLHVSQHIFLDPAALLEEMSGAAEMLTHGLTGVAHMMGKEEEHFLGQLRHEGTRVVPVFVLSLKHAPENLVLSNRELMAADHDTVVVLQLRPGARWGGPDDVYTAHMANGRPVHVNGGASGRHVIAGLAKALAGVVPPQSRFDPLGQSVINDWRWAAGATPFGPYSNYSLVNEVTQNAARRNLLLSHTSATLKHLQEILDDIDDFVGHHFAGPWEAAGMRDGGRHWLDTVVSTRHGYNSSFNEETTATMEGLLQKIVKDLEEMAVALYTHDWTAADQLLSANLLVDAANFSRLAEEALAAGEDVMGCCKLRRTNVFSRTLLTVLACLAGGAVFFLLLVVALFARGQRRKALQALGLPTYGLPTYSGKSGTWSL